MTATTELHDAKLEAACPRPPTQRRQLPQVLAEEDPALAEEAQRDGAVQHAAAAAAGNGAAAANGGPAAHAPANGAIGAGRMRVAAAAALVGTWPSVLTAHRRCASMWTHQAAQAACELSRYDSRRHNGLCCHRDLNVLQGAAAVRAKLMADEEEREVQHLLKQVWGPPLQVERTSCSMPACT